MPQLVGDPHGPRVWTPVGSPLGLRESLWAPVATGLPELSDGRRLLESRLRGFTVRNEHLIPDHMLRDLATDVAEQVGAVADLLASSRVRAAYANARAAVESAVDAVVLTSCEPEYDRRGADAYVFGALEVETLGRRIGAEETRLLGQSEGVEAQIAEDAAAWSAAAPGKGGVLRRAFEQFPKRPESARRHWSGMTNRQLYELVTATVPAADPTLARRLDGVYALLSMHAHPRPRFGRDAEEDRGMVCTTAWVALSLAVRALDARWRFPES